MDPDNERRVWGLLLETATRYSAQYFYLAPKFPRLLNYTSGINMLMCLNGSGKMGATSWDNKAILKRYSRKRKKVREGK